MTTAVATRESAGTNLAIGGEQTFFNDAQTAALVQMGLGEAPRGDIEVFFHQAKRSGLDPFARQIYMIERRSKVRGEWVSKWTIQTSIEGFRIIRDRQKDRPYRGHVEQWCGKDGVWKDVWLSDDPPAAARVLVSIEGFEQPVPGVALWSEYAPYKDGKPSGLWAGKPSVMLAKCAEALALRKAYPHDLSGLYADDEMAQVGNSSPAPRAAAEADEAAEVVEGEVVEESAGADPSASPADGGADESSAQRAIDEPSWQEQIAVAVSEGSVDRLRALWEHAQNRRLLGAPYGSDGLRLGDVLRQAKARVEEATS